MMRLRLLESRLGLRNSTTRIPFRYGKACLTRCPQAVLQVVVEIDGRRQAGYSGDCLPPSWFDKSPGKGFAQQIQEMLEAIRQAECIYLDEFRSPQAVFRGWLAAVMRISSGANERGHTALLASFGSSLVERAIIDATCRAAGVPFAIAVRQNLLGIAAGAVHPRLEGRVPADWLPPEPRLEVYARHTVGLLDPLTVSDMVADERLHDGFPQALEEYVEQSGIRYFKVKVSNQLDADLARLQRIVHIVESHRGGDYHVTLDGNEMYHDAEEFLALVAAIQGRPELNQFWKNVLVIEQPLERSRALLEGPTERLRELGRLKPVIIDESDGELSSFREAVGVGYRGVSSKNCKGTIKSLLNAGLVWDLNGQRTEGEFLMTGEDLCSVGVIPVQADLCLAATLGLEHVERNGHHYHPGLSYLPEAERQRALVEHADFYDRHAGRVTPRLLDGRFAIGSLQCVGFGFAVEPDMSQRTSPDDWDFSTLGLP